MNCETEIVSLAYTHWRSFKSEIDIRIECKFVPSIQFLLYVCERKRPLNISFTPLYIGESGYHMHFHRLSMEGLF